MIPKAELLDVAIERSLRPDIVEKDYALGWLLAGIGQHPDLANDWVFKGGTCLKKCHLETFRFSEDLDFTITTETHLNPAFLNRVFSEIRVWIYQRCGLEISVNNQWFEIYQNERGRPVCQGKVAYKGPISPPSWPRIKLDLTADEHLFISPKRLPVNHPYSDKPTVGIHILSYTYEEAFGEKVRALAQRGRPRDLYDVIMLFRKSNAFSSPSLLTQVIQEKCHFKGLIFPALEAIQSHHESLEASWEPMLKHQLPMLPRLEHFTKSLPDFFAWLAGERQTTHLMPIETPHTSQLTLNHAWHSSLPLPIRATLQLIRFAAAHNLCIDLRLRSATQTAIIRQIEPYALRQTEEDSLVLIAMSHEDVAPSSYRLENISSVSLTEHAYTPRYKTELGAEPTVH